MNPQNLQYQRGWAQANALADELRRGGSLPTQPTSMILRDGETYHCGVEGAVASYHGTDVSYDTTFFAVGSTWTGLAATAGASMLYSGSKKRKAEREAATQWRRYGVLPLHVTDQRLVIVDEGRFESFWYYDGISAFEPHYSRYAAMITPIEGGPMMLEGPAIPYLAVILHVHLRREVPTLTLPPPPGAPPPPDGHQALPPPPGSTIAPPPPAE